MSRRTRRIVGAITLTAAAYLIVSPFAFDNFRGNLELVNAGGTELFNQFLPDLQSKVGLTNASWRRAAILID